MKPLNTIPIESFLDKVRIASKTNQSQLTLSIKEAIDLQNSLSVVMTRLSGIFDEKISTQSTPQSIKVNGGNF